MTRTDGSSSGRSGSASGPREALAQAIVGHQMRLSGMMHGCGPECAADFLAALPEGWALLRPDPFSVWQGVCGHIWRKYEQEECPVCNDAQQERERLWTVVKELFDSLRDGYGHDPRFAAVWDAFHSENDR